MATTIVVHEVHKCPQKNGLFGELTVWHVIIFTSILAFLFLLDILTTQVILRMGGVELNPVMAGVVASPILHIILKYGVLVMIIPVALTAESRVRGSGVILYAHSDRHVYRGHHQQCHGASSPHYENLSRIIPKRPDRFYPVLRRDNNGEILRCYRIVDKPGDYSALFLSSSEAMLPCLLKPP